MSTRPLPQRVLVPLATVALLTAACSSSEEGPRVSTPLSVATPAPTVTSTPPPTAAGPTPTTSNAPAAPASITIEGFEYEVPASVQPGAEVQVTNQDREAHTVTLDRGAASFVVQGGSTTTFTAPVEPGTYTILCEFHGGMTAELVVAAA